MTKNLTMTAKEIADDVQQTFENVPHAYRQILEDRIKAYTKSKQAEAWEECVEAQNKYHIDVDNWIDEPNIVNPMPLEPVNPFTSPD